MNKNKSILIIGAKSDIGRAIASKYASKKYDLILASRKCSELKSVARDLKIRNEINVSIHELDILDNKNFNLFVDSLGTIPDVVVCAVGVLGDQLKDQQNINDSSIVMRSNYEGPSLLLGIIANYFEIRGSGTIIGISSVSGERGRRSNYIYGSAKAGFSTFLSGLRNRLSFSNVQVLTIKPGYVNTKMIKGIKTSPFLTSEPKKVAEITYNSHMKNKTVIYIMPIWKYIMVIIKLIPDRIFKNLNL